MKNFLNNPWVVGGLCVFALIMVYFRLFDTKPTREDPVQTVQAKPAPNVLVIPSPAPSGVSTAEAAPIPDDPQAVPITVGWAQALGRDPFQPIRVLGLLGDQELERDEDGERDERNGPTERVLRLHAVFLDGSTKVAMINRQLVKEGESVGGYIVDHIQREQVRLRSEEETMVLKFSNSSEEQSSES